MPYYTISYNQTDENVGNGFNREIISHQLREEAGYDGVVCTDWIITGDEKHPGIHSGKPWGVETMSVAERHYKALMAGVDQFGGNNEKGPVIEAYEMGVKEHGEEWMRARFERSARRLLLNIFRTGLFENPYVDVEHTKKVVGNPEFMQRGYEQQLKSVVMIKNHANLLPQKSANASTSRNAAPRKVRHIGATLRPNASTTPCLNTCLRDTTTKPHAPTMPTSPWCLSNHPTACGWATT